MNKWVFLALTAMTVSTVSLSAGCSTCGLKSNRGKSYSSKSSHSHRNARLNNYYSQNSNYRDRKDDQYLTSDDRQVLKSIHEGLAAQGFDYSQNNVHVSVEYGKVVFDGRVDSEQERELLREVAIDLPDVRHVIVDVHVDDIDPDMNRPMNTAGFRR